LKALARRADTSYAGGVSQMALTFEFF
jgi:hypothetical protein